MLRHPPAQPANAELTDAPAIASGEHLRPVDLLTGTPDWAELLSPETELNPDWTSHPPKELWRHRIGAGWSSFAAANGFAITMEQRGQREYTTCYDVETGQARWAHANPVRFVESISGPGPRATPAIAEGRVYALGATGVLDCLNGGTGQLIWSRNVLTDAGAANLIWGKTCTPLVYNGLVIVTGGAEKPPSLLAYQCDSGALAWKSGDDATAYASPVFANLDNTRQIVTVNAQSVCGHDFADGRLLWRFPWPGDPTRIPSPQILGDDRVFVSAEYGVGSAVLKITRDDNENFSAKSVWTSLHLKSKFGNPVIRNGYVYGLDGTVLTCLDLATGHKQWRGDSFGFGQILASRDLLLILSDGGELSLVNSSPDAFRLLGSFPALHEKTWAAPTLIGHRLLIRGESEAACFDLP